MEWIKLSNLNQINELKVGERVKLASGHDHVAIPDCYLDLICLFKQILKQIELSNLNQI